MTTELIEINTGLAKVLIRQRPRPQYITVGRGRMMLPTTEREYNSYPRVYVSTDKSFNVAEDFINRTRRPYNDWRQPTKDALATVGVAYKTMNWSQNAGCSMCPCSPGFILKQGTYAPLSEGHFDIWVTLMGAPAVNESQPINPARITALEGVIGRSIDDR